MKCGHGLDFVPASRCGSISRSLGDMLPHLLGIFDANLLQHYLLLEDLQSFDRTCSKEPDQITVLSDVHQDEVFQCMYPQSNIEIFDFLLLISLVNNHASRRPLF